MRKAGSFRKRPAGGVKWDEQNLQENEVIKATISKTKIDEPKTPYHGPLGEEHMEDADAGLQPLELDEPNHHPNGHQPPTGNSHGPSTAADAAVHPAAEAAEAAMDVDGGAAAGPPPPPPPHQPPTAGGGAHSVHPIIPNHHSHHGHHAHFDEAALSPAAGSGAVGAGGSSGGGGGGGSGTSTAATSEQEAYRSGFSSDSERRASLTGGSDADSEEARRKFEQRRRAHYNMRAALRRARLLLSEDGEGDGDEDEDGSGGDSGGGADDGTDAAMGDAAAGTGTGLKD